MSSKFSDKGNVLNNQSIPLLTATAVAVDGSGSASSQVSSTTPTTTASQVLLTVNDNGRSQRNNNDHRVVVVSLVDAQDALKSGRAATALQTAINNAGLSASTVILSSNHQTNNNANANNNSVFGFLLVLAILVICFGISVVIISSDNGDEPNPFGTILPVVGLFFFAVSAVGCLQRQPIDNAEERA